jgi:hypothetical protein
LRAEEDIIVADFEPMPYTPWTVTGEAFGSGPAKGTLPVQMVVDGFQGQQLVNSFVNGDNATGSLNSPAFVIERKFISFLIGGKNQEQFGFSACDRSGVELFASEGLCYVPMLVIVAPTKTKLVVEAQEGDVSATSLLDHELQSAWNAK